MSLYTISKCFVESGTNNRCQDVLLLLSITDSPHKVAIDKSRRIIDAYHECAKNNDHLALWLSRMNVDRFECVNIDIPINSSIKDVFLLVCSHAKSDKKIIVYSKETSLVLDEVELFSDEDGQTYMNYMGKKVVVIDRDEAYREVNPYNASKTVVNYKIQECFMGSKFEANQVGIQGDGACGNNITMLQFSGEYDMKKLAEELQWLILKCREEEINIAPEELEPIITAERAAADGNKEKVRLALKKTGVFLLGFAEKVGAGLVVQAIKHSCGI